MIDTGKYEGLRYMYDVLSRYLNEQIATGIELEVAVQDLLAEVKRLREAIVDIANDMEAADPSYLQGFIKDLLEVIE